MRRLGRIIVATGLGLGLLSGTAAWAAAADPIPLPSPVKDAVTEQQCKDSGGKVDKKTPKSDHTASGLRCVGGDKGGLDIVAEAVPATGSVDGVGLDTNANGIADTNGVLE